MRRTTICPSAALLLLLLLNELHLFHYGLPLSVAPLCSSAVFRLSKAWRAEIHSDRDAVEILSYMGAVYAGCPLVKGTPRGSENLFRIPM